MVKKLISLCLVLAMSAPVYAAPSGGASSMSGPRKQVATIVFAGLAGAILGLSTLSFYGRPQDKLSNIAIGFAIGIISGTIYTTYQTTTRPRDFYDSHLLETESWQQLGLVTQSVGSPMTAGYSWDF